MHTRIAVLIYVDTQIAGGGGGGGARWPSGRVSDSGTRGRGSIPTSAVLCP